jgi:tetratricopeptide (TPR) repeat protein
MTGPQTRAPFLGREAELASLSGGLDDANAGQGGLVLIGGEPGIGKSRLADELAGLARDRGFLVLWGRAWEDAGAPAYWPWIQILRSFLRQTDADEARRRLAAGAVDIGHILPEVRELFPELAPQQVVESDTARFQLFDSTASFLRSAADDRPIVVVLDDLQAADTSSLRLLRFVAGQLADMRLLVVGTYRDSELTPTHPLTDAIADLAREPTTRTLAVRGLDRIALRTLIGATAGREPNEQLVSAFVRGTRGNPLYASEAVRLLSAEGRLEELTRAASGHLAVPPGVRATIGRRLERLEPGTRALLAVGAVVGPEFDGSLLGTIAELDASALEQGLEEAVREGLLLEVAGAPGRYRFSHDLVRETLYDELGAGRRVRLHQRAAEVLEARHAADPGSHLAELAYHFFEGQPQGSVDAPAVDYARRAGDEATRSLAFEEAARLYEMALAALDRAGTSDPRARLDLLLALGEVHNAAGDVPAGREVLLEAAAIAKDLGAARELALAALGVGGKMAWSRPGFETRLVPLLQDALVHLGGADDRLRVKLLSRLACGWRSSPGKRMDSDALSRQAVDLARSLDDAETLSYALVGRFWAIWWPENPDERLRIATELFELAKGLGGERMLDARLTLFLIHTDLADMANARRELGEMVRAVAELRQPGQLWLGIANRALMVLMEGDFATAETILDEESDPGSYFTLAHDNVSAARMHRFLLRREQGRLAEIESEVRRSVDDFPWYPFHRCALASLLFDVGKRDEARVTLDELARGEFAALYPDNEWLLGMGLAAETAARLDARDACATLYAQLLPYAGRHAIGHTEGSIGAVDRYLGLVAGTLEQLDDAVRHLEAAVQVNERMGARPWTAHSRADLAAVLRRRDAAGDSARADALEAEALAMTRSMGMAALAARLEARGSRADGDVVAGGTGVFRREGEYWSIAFAGDAVRMKHSKGMAYLATLLRQPGHEVHAMDLASKGGDLVASAAMEEGLRVEADGGVGPGLDGAAKAAYRQRVGELRAEVAQAEEWNDPERGARASAELEALTEQLASATGLGGRDRPAASSAERARVSVTRAIKGALDRIDAEIPGLGGHLRTTVHTGMFCSYTPDSRVPITWDR